MKYLLSMISAMAVAMAITAAPVKADEFTEEDLAQWQAAFDDVVAAGRKAWTDPELGTNGVVCAQCHPNAANIHPETYPKFQKQMGRVVVLAEMLNWCIQNPLEGEKLALDDPTMVALQAYATFERRGVELEPGKH